MAVQLVLGRSGTGKTSHCVRAIAAALREPSEQPLLFLVPEQATYQAERAILSDPRIGGYHRLHILSFERLQFLLLGHNTARPTLSRIGRQMIVHKILRDNLDKLRIFGSSALLPGFAREMAATITELHQYAKNPEDIESLLAHLGGERAKAEDGGQKAENRPDLSVLCSPSSVIGYEPGKCIKCGLCIKIAAAASERPGLTFVSRGFDVRVAAPFSPATCGQGLPPAQVQGLSVLDLKNTARQCAAACPTGALALELEKG